MLPRRARTPISYYYQVRLMEEIEKERNSTKPLRRARFPIGQI